MFIDAHTHLGLNEFCDPATEPFKYDLVNRPDEFITFLNANGIDKAVILPIPGNNYDSIKSNSYLKEAVLKYPGRFIPFAKLDDNLVNNLLFNGFYGAKYHMVYEKYKQCKLELYYKQLEYYGFPLIVHAKFGHKVEQIKNIFSIAPNIKVILAHMGRGHIYTEDMVEDLLNEFKNYSNVYFETSTVGRSRMIEMACNIIGSNRLMFGSDYPFGKSWFKNTFSYNDEVEPINDARITEKDKKNIFSDTLLSIINECDVNRKTFYVRAMVENDKQELLDRLALFSDEDKKLLAIDKKMQFIKDCIRKCNHIYVAVENNKIVGFFRESGRTNNTYMLEEFAIFVEYRGRGYSKKMMDYYTRFFQRSYVKTHAKNTKMNSLLETYGFISDNGKRIKNWTKDIK